MSGERPYYEADGIAIYNADCRELLSDLSVDAVITDPPYGDTSLDWDRKVGGWVEQLSVDQLWCFGSMRFFLEHGHDFTDAGYRYGQEIVWEKHNGSGFHADRFKRVHEFAMHWYRGEWSKLYTEPVRVASDRPDKGSVRSSRARGDHLGANGLHHWEDDGMRMERSVLQVRSEHGRAVHPTQKPLGILTPLIRYSVPRGGLVLDPFMGSGSTLLAARQLGRQAIGIELDEGYCEAAVRRLGQSELSLEAA